MVARAQDVTCFVGRTCGSGVAQPYVDMDPGDDSGMADPYEFSDPLPSAQRGVSILRSAHAQQCMKFV